MAGRTSTFGAIALVGLALCALVLWAGRSSAAIDVSVSCSGSGGGPQGLIDAMQKANDQGGGTISLERNCTYTLTNGPFEDGRGQVGLPIVKSAITINGNGATIARADGSPAFRLLEVSDDPTGVLTIQDTTLRGGTPGDNEDAARGGGAILVNGPGSAWLSGTVFTGNESNLAGAVMDWEGTVRVTDSTFRGNQATQGIEGAAGAIANLRGLLIVKNSVITGNTAATSGGGIGSPGGINKITNTTITNNRVIGAESVGGGIAVNGFEGDKATLTVDRSTLSGNQAMGFGGSGGAIASLDGSVLTVTDSTISGNSAGQPDSTLARGGAVYSRADDASLTTTTIAGNRVLGDDATGGGLFASGFSPLTVTASIVAQGRRADLRGQGGGRGVQPRGRPDVRLHGPRRARGSAPGFTRRQRRFHQDARVAEKKPSDQPGPVGKALLRGHGRSTRREEAARPEMRHRIVRAVDSPLVAASTAPWTVFPSRTVSSGRGALSPARCRRRACRVDRSAAGAIRVSRWARPSSR